MGIFEENTVFKQISYLRPWKGKIRFQPNVYLPQYKPTKYRYSSDCFGNISQSIILLLFHSNYTILSQDLRIR